MYVEMFIVLTAPNSLYSHCFADALLLLHHSYRGMSCVKLYFLNSNI